MYLLIASYFALKVINCCLDYRNFPEQDILKEGNLHKSTKGVSWVGGNELHEGMIYYVVVA